MTEATWIPRENLDGDGTRLFKAFVEDARKEGADLSQDVVLLQDALDAGWDSVRGGLNHATGNISMIDAIQTR